MVGIILFAGIYLLYYRIRYGSQKKLDALIRQGELLDQKYRCECDH